MNEIVPEWLFRLVLSVVTGGVAALWVIHDIVLLARLRGADRGDPLVTDQRFGYVMGILIGTIGVVGTLRYNGVL
ncbi:MAG TPA: hypothetical protein VFT22_18260 [Kofleriaceae bacterium]|nr:hypothetical protein [Kofleriaceae bacterium]